MTPRRIGWLVAAAFTAALHVAPALAQCPDGTPPPCGGAAPPARRPNPALDERTWIVLPFENVTRLADIDWLKDASVNLLYLDMSKWRDIKVIDDERVADLIREVPEARGGQLTLQSGIAVARRAGAGRLVMGDLLKVGSRTQVVGKVFDVRSGQRLRTVRQEALSADSIMAAFGLLARGVLDVDPPAGTTSGAIGTNSVGAYKAYIAGVGFLNRWILDSAHLGFARALELDSAFALAHYKLSLVYGWESPNSGEGGRHADAALRLGNSLPTRERSLVAGNAAFKNRRNAEACAIFERMIRADSADVEAWYNLGECRYHDNAVLPLPGDSTLFRFRSSWNAMLTAFRKTLELDPTYHLAFQHIQDALLARNRPGCVLAPNDTECAASGNFTFQAAVGRAGDSLVTLPVNLASRQGPESYQQQLAGFLRVGARRLNLEAARHAAQEWLAAGPAESRPRIAYARILLKLGRIAEADSLLRQVPRSPSSRTETGNLAVDRIEIELKLGRLSAATRLADSLGFATDSISGARNLGILIRSVFGHTEALMALVDANIQGPPWAKPYFRAQVRAFVGLPADSVVEAEQAVVAGLGSMPGAPRAAGVLAATLTWVDPATRGGRWPASDTASSDPRLAMMSALATKDSMRIQRALARFDSIAASLTEEADNGLALAGAYGHLAVNDTLGALIHLRRFQAVTWLKTPILEQISSGFTFSGMLWPRTFLLLADLEAASGNRPAAVRAYQSFVGMWQSGDPEVQPMVRRAREAITRLSP